MSQYLPPQPQQLASKIDHIVILMLENRSFDNLLGWLYENETPPNGQTFEGLNPTLWNPLNNIDSDGNNFKERVPVHKNGQQITKGKIVTGKPDFTLPNPDPGEGFNDTNHQLFLEYKVGSLYPPAPINMGFVQNYNNAMLYSPLSYGDEPTNPRKIMACYTPEQTPVLSTLAKNFAVCDHYFASVPSQTLPNRSFIHAATSGGNVNNDPNPFCGATTIYNLISDAKASGNTTIDWGIYGNGILSKSANDKAGAFGHGHFSLTRLAMTQLHDAKFDNNFHTLEEFYAQCQAGTLPSYSFLEPNFGGTEQNDMHPPCDIRPGEQLIADIYNAVKASPAFGKTLLVITYDEHGGCYDHYGPPGYAENPDPDRQPGLDGFRFNRFGVRVPCILVNPYIPKGLIARPAGYTPFDHTSVIKTALNRFGLPPLTARSSAAPDLSCVLTLDTPRTDIPEVTPLTTDAKPDPDHVNGLHLLMAKMLSKLTNEPHPEDREIFTFICQKYKQVFGTDYQAGLTFDVPDVVTP